MVGQIWNIMLNQQIILLLNFRQDVHFQQKEPIVNYFFYCSSQQSSFELMCKSVTDAILRFCSQKEGWPGKHPGQGFPLLQPSAILLSKLLYLHALHISPTAIGSTAQGCSFLWWSKEKSLMGLPFYFLFMLCDFNFRLVGSEAHTWKHGSLPFFSAFKYYDCTTEVINIPKLTKSHIPR